jgi:hypothetical protein
MSKRKEKKSEPVVALLFTTALTGDEVSNASGTFVVKHKSVCERWLELVPSEHRSHAYPTRLSEYEFNQARFTLRGEA